MNDATMGASPAVVLLRDARWPQVPGVCCWRDGVVGAFAAAGAAVTSVECRPQQPAPAPAPVRVAAPAGAPTARRADWLPDPLRTVLVKAYRRARRSPAGPHRTVAAAARPESPPPARGTGAAEPAELSRADLVIAESLGAAATAARAGVPSRRLWVLALPPQWLPPGDGATGFAKELVAVADLVGGFLTDSELARESIERALSTRRPRVELFPPLAADRRCDACADAEPAAQPATDVDPAVTQLRRWRALRGSATDAVPYSFVAARLLGLDAPWAPMTRSDWQDGADTTPLRLGAEDGPADTSAAAQDRTAAAVLRGVLPEPGPPGRVARRAVVAGFDLKFAADLADRLARRDDLEIAVDDWPTLAKGTDRTEKHLDHADAVFAEWARTSAVWLSRNKRPGQFLAVRLHRFELDAKYPREIDMSNVDAVVYIAPLFGRRIRDELGWPTEKLVYIPNFIDLGWFDRPKLPDARFTLGFVGAEFARKRLDLALDLLAAVRSQDPRYTLAIRTAQPWANRYAWQDAAEREYVGWCQQRIERDPLLRGAVSFSDPGRDMARWYRRVGHLVSTSDAEGSHASVAEAMASGSVPVVRPWPGAAEVYDKQWVHDSTELAAAAVLATADADTWAQQSQQARDEIRRSHDPDAVVRAWADLLHGDVAAARAHFSHVCDLSRDVPAATPEGRS